MILIKNEREIAKMKESNHIVAVLLRDLKGLIKPGVSTQELDEFADDFIRSRGAKAAFKGYQIKGLPPFPSAICASVNSCIVHGIPGRAIILQEGDIIGIDVGVNKDGYYGDAAMTYGVGNISREASELLQITETALARGIAQAREGARIGDISHAIGNYVERKGYYVADSLTGHGIGRSLHEEPMVPNKGVPERGPRLHKGMTLAIEPMVNIGTNRVKESGWEFYVADGSLSAHFEHTILVTEKEPQILTKV
ncbi:MAG: type I methionyl aminopeptidase [Candidatus Cloacimonetes bacterium]|nr:type I methionyl aminopeptidase [Candidatus Cloacimonadota bacterium]